MAEKSSIEWTDATWNPVHGCTKVSPGCKNCYAETWSERFRGVKGSAFEHGFDLELKPKRLREPLKWGRPKIVFVNSMSDLFHDGVPNEYILQVCQVMVDTPRHQYQILTKRSARMRDLLSRPEFQQAAQAEHIWWGVSVEDRWYGLPRIDDLRAAPVRNRMLSIEPLLEDLGQFDLSDMHWAIIGGESGPHSRELDIRWVESIVEQCRAAGVPVFVKQLGAKPVGPEGPFRIIGQDGKKDLKGKTIENWPAHVQVREFPTSMGKVQPKHPPAPRRPKVLSAWGALEAAFAINTKFLTGEKITAAERCLHDQVLRGQPNRKPAAKEEKDTPQHLAARQTLGSTLLLFGSEATEEEKDTRVLERELIDLFEQRKFSKRQAGVAMAWLLIDMVAEHDPSL
jgi:protein gp37